MSNTQTAQPSSDNSSSNASTPVAQRSFSLAGTIVDVHTRRLREGIVHVEDGIIARIEYEYEYRKEHDEQKDEQGAGSRYILPGFVDAHVHVESSMLVPSEFARLAVLHGTVGTVSDPHEIANVLGIDGVRYMIDNGKQVNFKFNFGAPSCVPATNFETAGAVVTAADIRELFERDGLKYLSEMMNFPGVLFSDAEVMEKIAIAQALGKPIDGHAPGLRGNDAARYARANTDALVIATDHECFTLDEALDKLALGMSILIREGSAAKNYEALQSLISSHPAHVMFCSDDKHPNDLAVGHIDETVRRSVALGHNVFDVLRCACVNPVKHYGLNVGLLRLGDPADFIVVNNLTEFRVQETYIAGECVAIQGVTQIPRVQAAAPNNFNTQSKTPADFHMQAASPVISQIRVIEALDGQLITNEFHAAPRVVEGRYEADVERDILKIAVVNRYNNAPPAVAFIKNFGLKRGALASCVGHDSHNITAVGTSDEALCAAVNAIIAARGGIAVVDADGVAHTLALPVAGIMTTDDGFAVGKEYSRLDALAKTLGTQLHAPFMTLSFMALLVIPDLKLSDKGLFSGARFAFTPLEVV
jgi:adenine deaminase